MGSGARQTERLERIEPYLRQHQVSALLNERSGIEETLRAPSYIAGQIQDRGAMMKQIRHIDQQLNHDTPTPYASEERDAIVKREAELRERIIEGMCTQAEMRRSPAGAVDKHRAWERAKKADILEWKNIRVRMHATGMTKDIDDARDVANIERLRPVRASHELNMDNVQIEGQHIHLPPGRIEAKNVMSSEDREAHKQWLAQEVERQVTARLAAVAATGAHQQGQQAKK